MVFKRRNPRSYWTILKELFYPRGGWLRAFEYIRHRLRRLPDTPEKIARGLGVGVMACFTPFFGFHMVLAVLLAKLTRGNVIAALLGTFFGNPLTYVPIAAVSLRVGHFLLNDDTRQSEFSIFFKMMERAWRDVRDNVAAVFGGGDPHWDGVVFVIREFFWPFTLGGVLLGTIAGVICYYIALPLLHAYQNRRRNRLRAKLSRLSTERDEA